MPKGKNKPSLTIDELKAELARAETALQEKKEDLSRLLSLYQRQSHELSQLIQWLDQITHDGGKLLSSKRWKVGNTIGEIKRKAFGPKHASMPAERLRGLLAQYRQWRANYRIPEESLRLNAALLPDRIETPGQRETTGPSTGMHYLKHSGLDPYPKDHPSQQTDHAPEIRDLRKAFPDTTYARDSRFRRPPQPAGQEDTQAAQIEPAYKSLKKKSFFFFLAHLQSSGGPAVVMEIVRQLARRGYDTGVICLDPPDFPPSEFDVIRPDSARISQLDAIISTGWNTIQRLDDMKASGKFAGQKVHLCQSDEPSWWPPEKKKAAGYPGASWQKGALRAFRSKGYKRIIIADAMNEFVTKYDFDIAGKIRVATPRLVHLSPCPKPRPNWTVGFVNRGPTAWYKGRQECLAVLSLLRQRYPSLKIRSMGFEPRDGDLEKIGVDYKQNPSDFEVTGFYNGIDVLVSCAHIEGCPLPQQEAMWCGCPVVTSPAGVRGEYDLIGEQATCLVVDPVDTGAVANAVGSLLEDVELWNRFRYLGLRGISSRTLKRMVDDFVMALARALG